MKSSVAGSNTKTSTLSSANSTCMASTRSHISSRASSRATQTPTFGTLLTQIFTVVSQTFYVSFSAKNRIPSLRMTSQSTSAIPTPLLPSPHPTALPPLRQVLHLIQPLVHKFSTSSPSSQVSTPSNATKPPSLPNSTNSNALISSYGKTHSLPGQNTKNNKTLSIASSSFSLVYLVMQQAVPPLRTAHRAWRRVPWARTLRTFRWVHLVDGERC